MSLEGARWLFPDWNPDEPSDPAGKLIVVRLAELQSELEAKATQVEAIEAEKRELDNALARAKNITQKLIERYVKTAVIKAPPSEDNWTVIAIRRVEGDSVELFQNIIQLESSGTIVDISSDHAGLVLRVLVGPGEKIEPGADIVIVGVEKTDYPVLLPSKSDISSRPDPKNGFSITIDSFSLFSRRWSKNHSLAFLTHENFSALSGPLKRKIDFTPEQLNEINTVGKTFLGHEQLKRFYSERKFVYPVHAWLELKRRGHFKFSDLSNAKLDELSGIPEFRRAQSRRLFARLIKSMLSSAPFLYLIVACVLFGFMVFLKYFGLTILAGTWSLLKWLTGWV